MQPKSFVPAGFQSLRAAALMGVALVSLSAATLAEGKQPYNVTGTYVEGCSCPAPCPCEMTGVNMSCHGVGAMSLSSGKFQGTSLAGAKVAYAVQPGNWVRLYVDARNPQQKQAATAFAKSIFKAWGKVEGVEYAPISFAGSGGAYKVAVNGGKTMQLTTKPVMGRDKKHPIAHTNVSSPLTDTFFQGKTVSGSFKSAGHDFKLKGGNSYSYPIKASGKI